MIEAIDRQALLNAFGLSEKTRKYGGDHSGYDTRMLYEIQEEIENAPPVPLSEAYAKAVLTWMLSYQIKCAELKGRYSPFEILSWVMNDWRKDNELDS